jgi:hypothetical protein
MNFDKPPGVEKAEEKVGMAKIQVDIEEISAEQRKKYADRELRGAEENLAEEMLTPVQKEMSERRDRWQHDKINNALEKVGLSFEDLGRIKLHLEGVGEPEKGERILKGIILGTKDKPDHTIEIGLNWDGTTEFEKDVVGFGHIVYVGRGLIDKEPISGDLAVKIVEKYYDITAIQEMMTKESKGFKPQLAEESRESKLEEDLL